MTPTPQLALRFLGVGNAHGHDLGNSAAVLEVDGEPHLLIDCGPLTLPAFLDAYPGRLPEAIFITHTHLDHVGGLENLFYRAWFDPRHQGQVRLFVPAPLVEMLHRRVGDGASVLAEGGVNFWDCFRLVPVAEHFWHRGRLFSVFPARHHEIRCAFGLALEGQFFYSGDTRPIPEVLNRHACRGELIVHDCAGEGSPSHTGLADLEREYQAEQRRRMVLYHYESREAGRRLEQAGYRVARPGERIPLHGGAAPVQGATVRRLVEG